jgi:perosamine synthetase
VPDEPPIPLARPDVGEREEELVLEVLRSGQLSLGPVLRGFEERFAAWIGAGGAVAASSGTAALHLGVRALGWGPGDEVITSPLSFVATSNCLIYEGATPVFCDIDPETLNITPEGAAQAIGERTAGLLPVDIFGYPADMAGFERLAEEHGLGILEDACQAAGAVDGEGRRVGSRGTLATFAFYGNKQLVTGEGGMLVGSDPAALELATSERNQGRGPDSDWLSHERLGFNYRLSDLAAAIGLAQLERADEILERRAAVAEMYGEWLPADVEPLLADRPPARRSWFVYVVQLPDGADRDKVINELGARGIASKAYLPCIHLMPFYRDRFGHREGQFPVAEAVANRSLALPFFNSITRQEVERVCGALAEVLQGRP